MHTVENRRVLLAGASGYSGRYVTAELHRCGHQVIPLLRRQSDFALPAEIDPIIVEPTDRSALIACIQDLAFDAVISCMASRTGVKDDAWLVDYTANLNLLDAVKKRNREAHFVLLSALCVQKPRLAFQHAKLAFETRLAESGLLYTIVRPTAFFKSLAGQVNRILEGKPYLVFGDGTLTACKPIAQEDLAEYLVECLHCPQRFNKTLAVGGPGPALSPLQQADLLFEVTGRLPSFRHVPPSLFSVLSKLLQPFSKISASCRTKLELLRIGHYYATESMLVWDEESGAYSPAATPSFGSRTLADFYRQVIREGLEGHELGSHKLF